MTTREVYYKIFTHSELPVAVIGYTTKDKDDVIQFWNTLYISFHDGHEINIKKMEKIAKRKGFMFWNMSDEGSKFFETNAKEIAKVLAEVIINQK
jgi:hypothetical protein